MLLQVTSAAAPMDVPEVATIEDFASVYATWFRVVYRWVGALGGPRSDVEDVVQEVFVIVQRKLADFDGENLAGWLYRITQRTVRDHRRRSWFRRALFGAGETPAAGPIAVAADAAELLERRQERERFYRLVGRMNPKWRETFVLFEVVGHTGDEIATIHGIPPATVRTHLHRARKEFLDLVAKEEA
jgi:RNA polymerase sigma-70 factor, ECF subfamily